MCACDKEIEREGPTINSICCNFSFPVLGSACCCIAAVEHATQVRSNLVTQTVYGFLDFTTTIGNTVMVFSPQSAPPPGEFSFE